MRKNISAPGCDRIIAPACKSAQVILYYALITCTAILLFFPPAAKAASNSEELLSPSVAKTYYDIACELSYPGNITGPQNEQALIFLKAALSLDGRAVYVLPEMIKLACRDSGQNRSQLVRQLLAEYVNDSADMEIVNQAVNYLLDQLNSREQREQLLTELLQTIGSKNQTVGSQLATLLGILMIEKTDFQSAVSYMMRAYNSNKYNELAFVKLSELFPTQISPAMRLEHFRRMLAKNPLNLDAAMAFAKEAELLQLYDMSAQAYEYCADLFGYLQPDMPLPASIYLPWSITSYNTKRSQYKCLQIAKKVRSRGQYALVLEAIAGHAAMKTGAAQEANEILQSAKLKAEQIISNMNVSTAQGIIDAQKAAWFFCFAMPDAGQAVVCANAAYAAEPNSPAAAALLAYALVIDGQVDIAKALTENYESNQIMELAKAKILLAQGSKDKAVETLKSAIDKASGTLEVEEAKKILAQNGGEYIAPIPADPILSNMENVFGKTIVPVFAQPEKLFSILLNIAGSKFAYGSEFDSTIIITNKSPDEMVICDDGLLIGNIRIDAEVSGDLSENIPNLVSMKVQPAMPIGSGKSLLIPVQLVKGKLRKLLNESPQANLNIKFTLFIDAAVDANGHIVNRLTDVKAGTLEINRSTVEVSGTFIQNRVDSFARGNVGRKFEIAKLFVGLLQEEYIMAKGEPKYKYMYADRMTKILKSSLKMNLTGDDWISKAQIIAALCDLPMDYDLISAVAENLNDSHWPVRLMAVYLLSQKPDTSFQKVLNWTAQYDSNVFVRDMAVALGAVKPQPPQPPKQTASEEPNKPISQPK